MEIFNLKERCKLRNTEMLDSFSRELKEMRNKELDSEYLFLKYSYDSFTRNLDSPEIFSKKALQENIEIRGSKLKGVVDEMFFKRGRILPETNYNYKRSNQELREKFDEYISRVKRIQRENRGKIPLKNTKDYISRRSYIRAIDKITEMVYDRALNLSKISKN